MKFEIFKKISSLIFSPGKIVTVRIKRPILVALFLRLNIRYDIVERKSSNEMNSACV